MKVVVLGSRGRSAISWRGRLVEVVLGAAGGATKSAFSRDIAGALATASARGLRDADTGTIGVAAPA